jgi:hypothetical protein
MLYILTRFASTIVRQSCPSPDAALTGVSAARLSANQVAAGQEVPRDRCRLLKFCAALQKKRSTAHEKGLLSRRPEAEEFWAAGAKGGKNRRRASARRELQDVAGLI